MKPSRRSLWAWLTWRMIALAIAATAAVQAGMWVRYSYWESKNEAQLPPGVAEELRQLENAPKSEEVSKRLVELYTQYGDRFAMPSDSDDLLIQMLLSLSITPFVAAFGLLLARRIVEPVSDVATAAESVSMGRFSARAPVLESAPAELQRLANHFNAMAERLEAYDRELQDSSAAIAHELRTPLTAAMGRLQGIVDEVFPLDERQIRTVLDQLGQINRIIGDLQVLSLAQGGRLQLEMTEFDLHGFVEERLSWALPSLQERGMTAANHVSGKETVRADRGRLGQVLSALVDNAVRYASDGRLVEIDCRADASTLELIVRDRGKSASVDDVSRFFERFWRSERSRSRYAGGTGLGLSVVQAICKAHGGEAKAAARPGGGLEIRICLPRDQGLRRSIGG